jgi:hypothetical protein
MVGMPDCLKEKKAEYLQKWRIARQQNKAAALISINSQQVSQTPASSLPTAPHTPSSAVTNTHKTGTIRTFISCYIDGPYLLLIYGLMISCCVPEDATDMAAISVGADQPPEEIIVGRKKQSGQGWYARLSEDKKEEYRKK